ncbi:MAG: hypothetical protein M1444_04285, partial [Patescibacteria group bacterium]|nr:hypothetical protein [Patescibacteria group bacterium]
MAVPFANQVRLGANLNYVIIRRMNLKNLQQRITTLNEKTKPHYKLYTQEEKEILTKTVKLNEEVGELCN